ncbi:hypothetical protein [Streptomyces roseifaciens]|uniref:hypothetical protein n=1 Tax=Streptomyces roseifaciens TaxID=1488406 RepID=UPI000A42A15B|nr:hypothetical protein [Streptomyces roseifaciens]
MKPSAAAEEARARVLSQMPTVINRYNDGEESMSDLAASLGVGHIWLRAALVERGVRIRGRSEAAVIRWRRKQERERKP